MNNQLATKPDVNGRITTQANTDALLATLPKWLAYLVGAFPAAQVNKMTYLAYETAFADVDPSLMLAAVQAVAKTHRFSTFPTIAEIDQAIASLQQRAEVSALSERATQLRIRGLMKNRELLLERAYTGDVDPDAWQTLAEQFESIGFEVNADWARRKLAQFMEAAHAATVQEQK